MKYTKEDLEKMILIDKLSYREIGRKYDVSDAYIKKISIKLGISLPIRQTFPKDFIPHNKGTGKTTNCKNCGKLISLTQWHKKQFCDSNCFNEYKIKRNYDYYLGHQEEYCNGKCIKFIKKHILEEQNHKCMICGNDDMWNNKVITFILDHIDGNAYNNHRINIRLVCPNCDSQLDTYKSKNKNSARKERYLLNYKNRPHRSTDRMGIS